MLTATCECAIRGVSKQTWVTEGRATGRIVWETLRVVSAAAKTSIQTLIIIPLLSILILFPLFFPHFLVQTRKTKAEPEKEWWVVLRGRDGPPRARRQAAIAAGLCVSVASTLQALSGLVPALEPTLAGVGTTLANLCRPARLVPAVEPGQGL